MVHIKQDILGSTLCNLSSGQHYDWVSLPNLSFYPASALCPECNFRLGILRGPRRKVKEDSHFDTPLAQLVKAKMKVGELPYNEIEKQFPEWKSSDVDRYIKTVCGWN